MNRRFVRGFIKGLVPIWRLVSRLVPNLVGSVIVRMSRGAVQMLERLVNRWLVLTLAMT